MPEGRPAASGVGEGRRQPRRQGRWPASRSSTTAPPGTWIDSRAVEKGARAAGAEIRRRHVEELAPEEAIAGNEEWAAHRQEVRGEPTARLDDLEWADALVFGSPTRFGNVAAQLKQFLDQAGGLWEEGKLADKVASGFTSTQNPHGGQETTLMALYATMFHWGAIVVTPGYTDERVFPAGGNPYGASSAGEPSEAELEAARYLGERAAGVADRLAR
jgi:NAD(P)H dehydrogenase (quinone)